MNAITANVLEDAALRACSLVRGLADNERGPLFAHAPTQTFAPGETIFLTGSPGDTMMAVLNGSVRISVSSPDGNELTLAIIRKGEVFGEIALLDRKERTADATALTACRVAVLERREILSLLERRPGALLGIVDLLCGRLRRTDQHLAELALLPVPVRLAKALLRLTTGDSCAANVSAGRPVRLSQRELGTIVAASRESINKCLRAWQSRGVVLIKRGFVTIVDRPALEELAEMARPAWNGCHSACGPTRRSSIDQAAPPRSWRRAPSPAPTTRVPPNVLASAMADRGIGNRAIEAIGRS